jgi:hypothetical protein
MATRSRIGMELENGTIKSIYCHWDGYPSHNGRILLDHYQDVEKVKALIELGDISSLNKEVSTDAPHSFDKPCDGVTVAYHRDRGEPFNSRTDVSLDAFRISDFEQYGYVFTKEGKWVVAGSGRDLKEVLEK